MVGMGSIHRRPRMRLISPEIPCPSAGICLLPSHGPTFCAGMRLLTRLVLWVAAKSRGEAASRSRVVPLAGIKFGNGRLPVLSPAVNSPWLTRASSSCQHPPTTPSFGAVAGPGINTAAKTRQNAPVCRKGMTRACARTGEDTPPIPARAAAHMHPEFYPRDCISRDPQPEPQARRLWRRSRVDRAAPALQETRR